MPQALKRIAITGGAGQIAYQLLFRVAQGELFGPQQPLALHILEIPEALEALQGVKMELDDCAFPLLKEIQIGSDPYQVFGDIDFALLVGAKPRGPGMERKDLLQENGKIFIGQGKALNEVAKPHVQVFVIGNPCNTNCLITMSHAPRIPRENFYAMTRLDQNRATFQLAQKAKVDIAAVSNVTIWGNHSTSQVPDFFHARIYEKPVVDVIQDQEWLKNDFIQLVQKRGAEVIKARGKSSAGSAANAIIDSVKDRLQVTPSDQFFSSGVYAKGNPYGIQEDLVFSFPCRMMKEGKHEIVPGLAMNDFLESKLKITEKELIEERELVKEMINY